MVHSLLLSVAVLATPTAVQPKCVLPMLMMRTEASPRSADFTLGADAFDKAAKDWSKRRYLEAARGFMAASAHFATAGVEGNWKYAWQNAALAFEVAGKIDDGMAAFEEAAKKDAPHAEALRAAGASLTSRAGCR